MYSYYVANEEQIFDSSYKVFLQNTIDDTVSFNTINRIFEAGTSIIPTKTSTSEQTIANCTDPTKVFSLSELGFAFTPNQPTRYYMKDACWTVERNAVWYIGIGYIDPVTNTVSEIFSNAQTYGYVPNGVTTGTTLNTLENSFSSELTRTLAIGPTDILNPLVKPTFSDPQATNSNLYWGGFSTNHLLPVS